MKKKGKIAIIVTSSLVACLALAVVIPFAIMGAKTANMNKDWQYLKNDTNYSQKAETTGLNLVKQHISCGYASIEMISDYYGDKVTEDVLDARNKSVSTASSDGFLKEINRCIPTQKFVMRSYLKNDVLLKEIHNSLEKNNPVALEWAAKYENKEWTLHFSVITGLDLSNDVVTVYNPYGYIENIGVDEFISRSTFNAYKNIPLFLNFGFAFGAFHKNTIFYAK